MFRCWGYGYRCGFVWMVQLTAAVQNVRVGIFAGLRLERREFSSDECCTLHPNEIRIGVAEMSQAVEILSIIGKTNTRSDSDKQALGSYLPQTFNHLRNRSCEDIGTYDSPETQRKDGLISIRTPPRLNAYSCPDVTRRQTRQNRAPAVASKTYPREGRNRLSRVHKSSSGDVESPALLVMYERRGQPHVIPNRG